MATTYPYGALPKGWEGDVLKGVKAPTTKGNVHFLDSWEVLEQGNPASAGMFNPLNTTLREPGSTTINPDGVQNFPNWQTGLKATLSTIEDARYSDIVAQLDSGKIKENQVVISNDFLTWSHNAYDRIDTSQYKVDPSKTYKDQPSSPDVPPSGTNWTPFIVVGAILLALLVFFRK